jgi:very-short-patch-repair endonuclease
LFERKTIFGNTRRSPNGAFGSASATAGPGGFKFRRQHPLETRIVDFFCEEAKIAIEIDGSGHRRHLGQCEDLDRELDLYEKDIRVLRFSNRAVLSNLDRVVNEIIFAIDPERSL